MENAPAHPLKNQIETLNAEQKRAVLHVEGPLLVLAGAGSGKTRVVTLRMAHLIELGIAPSNILGLTFTNKASQEMRERVEKLMDSSLLVLTFHSLGARILRESIQALGYNRYFNIYDEEDSEKLLKSCINEMGIKESKGDFKVYRQMISQFKNNLQKEMEINGSSPQEQAFPTLFNLYQNKLKEYNAVDFDDLLYLPVRLFEEHPTILEEYQDRWPFLLIDEYQDTNGAQYALVQYLAAKSRNIFVVGDPDQSIYSWRGANINNILHFEKDYPGAAIVRLEQNYRSTNTILEAANALISKNEQRYEKKLWSAQGAGSTIKCYPAPSEELEAAFVAMQMQTHHQLGLSYKQMAVLYRTNAQSRIFEDALLSRRIPYVIVGGISFYQRREIKDLLAFLKLIQSGADFIAFARTVNLPKRGIGEVTLEKLRVGASSAGLPILAFCRELLSANTTLKLPPKQRESLGNYLQIISSLQGKVNKLSLSDLVKAAIEETGYLSVLQEDPESFEDRKENLNGLISKAVDWESGEENPSLDKFLEELSLKSTLDEASEDPQETVYLMTLHNGKGLEFEVVFLTGLEENLFPHINAKDNPSQLEEERRLCYVGLTRAKKDLYVSFSYYRTVWGITQEQIPSRFIREIPSKLMEKVSLRKPSVSHVHMPPIPEKIMQQSFQKGDLIMHKDFGEGEIIDAFESSLGMAYKIVFTQDHSTRTIIAKYTTLKLIT